MWMQVLAAGRRWGLGVAVAGVLGWGGMAPGAWAQATPPGSATTAAVVSPWADTLAWRAQACTGCHGDQGRASPAGHVPRLAGKPAGYLFDQIQAFRDGRRAHHGMARLLAHTDDRLLRALAEHFAQQVLPYPPPAQAPPPAAAAQRAQQIVQHGLPEAGVPACVACHGGTLTGVAPQVPGLLGLPRGYVIGQMGAWRSGVRQARAPDCMASIAKRLPAADLPGLADWLAAQPVPGVEAQAQAQARARLAADAAPRPPADLPCAAPQPVASSASDAPSAATTAAASPSPLTRGAYLARVANCAGCHSRRGSDELSGGEALDTGFGLVYGGNLTPDAATGLGSWTADDFWRALNQGRGRDGRRLVPAFPYTSYTHLSRADSDALFAYLRSLPPVKRAAPAQALRFPFGTQAALAVWQTLFFTPAKPAPASAVTVNTPAANTAAEVLARGRYLVQGPGHCLECHAPRSRWGAPGRVPSGGLMPPGEWWAPALQPWLGQTEDDLVALLRDGRGRHGAVVGPMAEVVARSTRHWREEDLRATARYLLSLGPATPPGSARGDAVPADRLALGQRLYDQRCAACHGREGQGVGPGIASGAAPAIAPLAGNPSVLQPQVHNLLQMLRYGGFGLASHGQALPFGMPPQLLTPLEQAAVLSYIRQAWGNRAGPVSEVDLLVLD